MRVLMERKCGEAEGVAEELEAGGETSTIYHSSSLTSS